MAVDYSWTIAQMERNVADGGVIVAHWRCNAEETVGDTTYYAGSYGTCGFTYDASAPDFVPYDQLTEMKVLEWVFDEMGVEQVTGIQEALYKNIEEQKAPTTEAGVPW